MRQILINEYENYLLGNKNQISALNFANQKSEKEKTALEICKYVIENILGWTPDEAAVRFNAEVVERMKLDNIIGGGNIAFPTELDEKKDYFYVIYLLYPGKVVYDERNAIVNIYRRMLARDYNPDKKKGPAAEMALKAVLDTDPWYAWAAKHRQTETFSKLPKKYAEGTAGVTRIYIFLQYALESFIIPFYNLNNIEEVYELFSDTQKAYEILRTYKLASLCRDNFDTPLDYLHMALPDSQKNEMAYYYFKYKQIAEEENKKTRNKESI